MYISTRTPKTHNVVIVRPSSSRLQHNDIFEYILLHIDLYAHYQYTKT